MAGPTMSGCKVPPGVGTLLGRKQAQKWPISVLELEEFVIDPEILPHNSLGGHGVQVHQGDVQEVRRHDGGQPGGEDEHHEREAEASHFFTSPWTKGARRQRAHHHGI